MIEVIVDNGHIRTGKEFWLGDRYQLHWNCSLWIQERSDQWHVAVVTRFFLSAPREERFTFFVRESNDHLWKDLVIHQKRKLNGLLSFLAEKLLKTEYTIRLLSTENGVDVIVTDSYRKLTSLHFLVSLMSDGRFVIFFLSHNPPTCFGNIDIQVSVADKKFHKMNSLLSLNLWKL